jgi:hypothetical protein
MNLRARTILHDHCGHVDSEGFFIRAMEVYAAEVSGQRPCDYIHPEMIDEGTHEEGGFIVFSNARKGVFELWGQVEGSTVAIVRDAVDGKVSIVPPQYIKFTN